MQSSLLAMVRCSAVGVLSIAACSASSGGASGGTGSVSGTVAGTTFTVASELAVIGPGSTSCNGSGTSTDDGGPFDAGESCTSSGQALVVMLTNRSDATCSAALNTIASKTDYGYASYDDLELAIVTDSGNVSTGTYTIVGSQTATSGAVAGFATTTSTCALGVNTQATSGSITLSQFSSTRVSGTYRVTFGTQGTFTGSFDVSICDIPDGGFAERLGDGGKPACQP